MTTEEAERQLRDWAATVARRDDLFRAARRAGISKNRIHTLTGVSRTTIDRIPGIEDTMTTTTTLARSGKLGYDENANGWADYISGGDFTGEQADALVTALMDAQEAEVNKRLPAGCFWSPRTSEIIGPVGTELEFEVEGRREDPLRELMEETSEAVGERFDEIERATLGDSAEG